MNDLHFFKNSEIDRKKWSATLAHSSNRHIFAEAWYLDVVAPNWGAFVREDYEEIFPLPIKKMLGFSYLVQPKFTAQLGLFSSRSEPLICDEYLSKIQRKFRRYNFTLNAACVLKNHSAAEHINCELPLNRPYEELASNFSKNAKRNIKKAAKIENHRIESISFERFFDFKIAHLQGIKPEFYKNFGRLYEAMIEQKTPMQLIGFFVGEELQSAAFFVEYYERIYYFNGASSPSGKASSAMFGIFNFLIKNYANSDHVLDFKGGKNDRDQTLFHEFRSNRKKLFASASKILK